MNVSSSYDDKYDFSDEQQRVMIRDWGRFLETKVIKDGWNPYLLTFMFREISSSETGRLTVMRDAVERFYSTFITRVARNPNSAFQISNRPLFLGAPDYPTFKHKKKNTLRDASVNDGLHMHSIIVMPWKCRLKQDLITHVQTRAKTYIRDPLQKLHIELIEDELPLVTDYVLKSIKKRRFSWDDAIILPKSRSEYRPTSKLFEEMVRWIDAGILPAHPPQTLRHLANSRPKMNDSRSLSWARKYREYLTSHN